MSTTKKRKSAKETRVLVASIITAAAIIAGSTFAWFTSTDEVTNRLSSNANYGVTIAEDFTPPYNWLPGQEVDKNVAIVNTGNVDAFVRTWLEGEMKLTTKMVSKDLVSAGLPAELKDTDDETLISMGLKKYYGTGSNKTYLKVLSSVESQNPKDILDPANLDTESNDTTYSEIKSVQAGGWLAYASEGAAFTYTTNQAAELIDVNGVIKQYAAGAEVSSTELKDYWSAGKGVAIDSDTFKPTKSGLYVFRRVISIEPNEEQQQSSQDGLPVGMDYAYAGYYYDADGVDPSAQVEGQDTVKGIYYALQYDFELTEKTLQNFDAYSDYVFDNANEKYYKLTFATEGDNATPVVKFENVGIKFYEAEEKFVKNDEILWEYIEPGNSEVTMTVTPYKKGDQTVYVREDDEDTLYADEDCTQVTTVDSFTGWVAQTPIIKTLSSATQGEVEVPTLRASYINTNTMTTIRMDVALDKNAIGEGAEQWTKFEKAGATVDGLPSDNAPKYYTFYYNNDLEEGDTTSRLVDSVTLSKDIVKDAYLAFDFDLNVLMNSIQISLDNKGNEVFDSVKDWATTNEFVTVATATETAGTPEIETIKWQAAAAEPGVEPSNPDVGP